MIEAGMIERLKARAEFLRAARGRKYAMPGLVLQAHDRRAGEPGNCVIESGAMESGVKRVGFTVTRKIGNAVARNRVRRRLRAAAGEVLPRLGRDGFDYVLIGRAGTALRPYRALLQDLTVALSKVHPET